MLRPGRRFPEALDGLLRGHGQRLVSVFPRLPALRRDAQDAGRNAAVLAETWDEYMRTPLFMEMMKGSLNGALDLKRMARDGMNRVHEQFENPSKEDIDGVLMAIH